MGKVEIPFSFLYGEQKRERRERVRSGEEGELMIRETNARGVTVVEDTLEWREKVMVNR